MLACIDGQQKIITNNLSSETKVRRAISQILC